MDLSVIIPARNEESRLGSQLDALLAQCWAGDWEVVVVDNGSTDGTAELVEARAKDSPRIRLVRATAKADKSYAIATAMAQSGAASFAICDADDVVAEGWLAAVANGLAQHEVVTGPNELDMLNPPWLAGSRGRTADQPVGTFAGIFPFVRGNNFGVRAEVISRIGGLTEGFYPVEDLEFSLRCWLNGIDVVGLPDAVVHYRYRDDPRTLWRQGWTYGLNRPRIGRLLRDAGQPTPAPFAGWRSWALLVLKFPTLVTRHGRANWLWIAANRLGQLLGSFRQRIVML